MQIVDAHGALDGGAAATDGERDGAADRIVERRLELDEGGAPLAAHLEQNVAYLERGGGGALGQQLGENEDAAQARLARAQLGLGVGGQPEAARLVEGLVDADGLQRAARHRLVREQQRERARRTVKREEEPRRRARLAAGVECDRRAVDVEDGRARRAAGGAARAMEVEG